MRERLPMWVPGVAVAAALVALVAWSFWQRWMLLTASPFPLGVDGYFYPIQLRALLAHGELAYPASPLAFYLLAPFAAATDPITGAKLGTAIYGAAVAIPAYGVGARLGGGRGAGLIAAALATTSVGSAYLNVEFVKNGIGLTVALGALWLALAAADRPTRPRLAAALAGLVAAWATHKMAAALVVAVAIPAGVAAATAHGRLRGRRLLYLLAAIATAAITALALAAAFPHRFLGLDDAGLLAGLLSTTPRWTAPALASPSGDLAVGHDALIGFWLALAAIAGLVLRRRSSARRRRPSVASAPSRATAASATTGAPSRAMATAASATAAAPSGVTAAAEAAAAAAPPGAMAAPASAAASAPSSAAAVDRGVATTVADPVAAAPAWPILVLAVLIGLPFLAVDDAQGLGFRLRIAAFVPMALTAAVLVRVAAGWLAMRAQPARTARRDAVLAALAVLLVAVRQPGATRLAGEVVTHPALVSAAQALRGRVPPGATLIVPERHIAFMVAWYTGASVAIQPGGVPPAQRYRLLPLHFIRAGSPLDRELMAARAEPSLVPPLGLHPSHPNGLVLVAEPTWNWIVDRLPPADRDYCTRWPTL